ncbi:17414_t:CDS:2, partial [Funneliformis caledonium]
LDPKSEAPDSNAKETPISKKSNGLDSERSPASNAPDSNAKETSASKISNGKFISYHPISFNIQLNDFPNKNLVALDSDLPTPIDLDLEKTPTLPN